MPQHFVVMMASGTSLPWRPVAASAILMPKRSRISSSYKIGSTLAEDPFGNHRPAERRRCAAAIFPDKSFHTHDVVCVGGPAVRSCDDPGKLIPKVHRFLRRPNGFVFA